MRGGDRRERPRRREEIALHYAEVGLQQAALAVVDESEDPYTRDHTLSALGRAAALYRQAVAELDAANAARVEAAR